MTLFKASCYPRERTIAPFQNLAKSACVTAVTLGLAAIPVRAATLGDWNYAIDSFNDSTARSFEGGPTDIGGTIFEIYGLAFKEDTDTISIAINSNLPQTGDEVPYAQGFGHTGWGDLFFDTSDGLYAINFATINDSGAASTGVYRDVSTKSVTADNDGWSSNSNYINAVTDGGGNPSMGDLAQTDSLFGDATDNLIASGTKIGDIFDADLSGLDFGNLDETGTHTFGFSFDKSLMPTGDFVAYLFQECFNDTVALMGNFSVPDDDDGGGTDDDDGGGTDDDDGGDDGGNVITPQPVPEPSTFGLSSIAIFGILIATRRLKRQSDPE